MTGMSEAVTRFWYVGRFRHLRRPRHSTDRIHWLQRALALAAALEALLVVVSVLRLAEWGQAYTWATLVTAAAVVAPAFLGGRREAFVGTCLALTAALVAWAVAGCALGGIFFLPAALLLLFAALADPRRRPVGAWVACVPGVLLTALVLCAAKYLLLDWR
ncbi:hypothetical protein ABT084_09875 [Streptomyces sp. NPDC002138]|uniref:hypothetical protein n=1 Tax=Streptomyces sp. NPDC002138 TaxID=3154410 RepID=UPI00332697D0